MSPLLIISVAAFIAVTALVGAVAVIAGDFCKTKPEDRLQVLAGVKTEGETPNLLKQQAFREGLDGITGFLNRIALRLGNVNHLFEQAGSPISANVFLALSIGCGTLGAAGAAAAQSPAPLYPVMALVAGSFPLLWLLMRRRSRMKRFAKQLPEALELMARALRSGHSLVSGMQVVADEMLPPISMEFGLVCESQIVGKSLDQALKDMLLRMPNRDLRFFVTSVVMQRQMGGNLAEILDKISYIVRERFKILGQVQALTGEGRISGIVLMALPIVLFFTVYHLNPEYVMLLFTDVVGRKMLAVAAVLQIVGALSIKKIIDIKI